MDVMEMRSLTRTPAPQEKRSFGGCFCIGIFSTKYIDEETGLYYYGYRYYSAELGRWISRDPIEEKGSNLIRKSTADLSITSNLYAFNINNPVNMIDLFGLIWVTVDYDYDGTFNWLRWLLLRIGSIIGKGDDPSFGGSDPDEYLGMKRDVIQVWQCDPDNASRNNEYGIGARRRVAQIYIKQMNPGSDKVIISDPDNPYFHHWTPIVPDRTYEDFPDAIIEYDPYFYGRGV